MDLDCLSLVLPLSSVVVNCLLTRRFTLIILLTFPSTVFLGHNTSSGDHVKPFIAGTVNIHKELKLKIHAPCSIRQSVNIHYS